MDQQPAQQPTEEQKIEGSLSADLQAKQARGKTWNIIGAVVVLILLAGGAVGFWQYQKQQAKKQPTQNEQANTNTDGNVIQPGDSNYPTSTPPAINNFVNSFESAACKDRFPLVTSRSGLVEWVQPQKQEGLKIFASTTPNSDYIDDDSYLVGHVIGGAYKGGDILLTVVSYMGMGITEEYDRIIRLDGQYYLLANYSDQFDYSTPMVKSVVKLTTVKDFVLPDLDFPKTLRLQNPAADFSMVVQFAFYAGSRQPFCGDNLIKAFTDSVVGDVYTDVDIAKDISQGGTGGTKSGLKGFYVKAPDGTMRTYQLDIPIVGQDKVPLVLWNSGSKNTQEYSYQGIGGCGANSFRDVVAISLPDLVKAGTTVSGQAVYEYKDTNLKDLQDSYSNIYVPDGKTKPSYNDFILSHPIFFWQDPFGKFIRFKSLKYQPMAECGKPVIYLYPKQTQKISVEVNPLGGMSFSDPAYGSGWNVVADPLSNITNLADGKVYPYLFWEGRGGMYQTPERGFVIAQADIHQFLIDKLSQLGLNQKESADFMEFWEPKMQEAPYYFVTFMGNSVMDELAPLTIIPKPDTIIRVLMDFVPLDHPVSAVGYNIHTPVRQGFTVVEWGGVLRK